MKTTTYFDFIRHKADREMISNDWINYVITNPEFEEIQEDGRIRCWRSIPEYGNRYLRVILLNDRETVHNAFFDRGFKR